MSKFSDYLKRPASVTTDAVTSVAVGVVAGVVLNILIGVIPFGTVVSYSVGGLVSAMTYMRARDNLNKPKPNFI
jgi:F0F1-type ATP synthase assembly protein I